jgi:hypothetical protein
MVLQERVSEAVRFAQLQMKEDSYKRKDRHQDDAEEALELPKSKSSKKFKMKKKHK